MGFEYDCPNCGCDVCPDKEDIMASKKSKQKIEKDDSLAVHRTPADLAAPASTAEVVALKEELATVKAQMAALRGIIEELRDAVSDNLEVNKKRVELERRRGAVYDGMGNCVLESGEAGGIFGR